MKHRFITMTKEIRLNLITYFIFILIAVAGTFYGNTIARDFSSLRVWNISNILLLLAGVPFLFLQAKSKLPDFWQNDISGSIRFLIPLTTGFVFGILDVVIFKLILHPESFKELPPFAQPFPYSVFLYFSGAFEVEVFYRLIPLTLILLAGRYFKKGTYYQAFFWAGAILTAIREPLEQLPQGGFLLIVYSLTTGFLMNLIQAVFFRRAGFLASLSVRLGHYLIWHILLGLYIQLAEI